MRPWNVLGANRGDSVICYPVSDESIGWEPGSPPPDLVRLHKALGDDKRLRMLSVLAGTDEVGLQELAESVDLAKSSAHHHLVILRAAGLVAVTTDGRGRYRLRKDFIPEASAMLGSFLGTA
jgi:DNA-binding transcriptional ArsR family regulator